MNGGWDNDNQKEYIFKRINDWLEKYFGKDHGITLGITETDLNDSDPMVTALIYASFLGTMQDNGVEIFTPWTWGDGMYETVHLFSRYGHPNRVQSTSSNDSLVSAYSSITSKGDSLTVIFVNRTEKDAQQINLSIPNFAAKNGNAETLTLTGIKGETFVSHKNNALKKGSVEIANDKATLTLPAKSITALLLTTDTPKVVDPTDAIMPGDSRRIAGTVNYSIAAQGRTITAHAVAGAGSTRYTLSNVLGQVIESGIWNQKNSLNISVPHAGKYILRIGKQNHSITVK